MDKELQSFRDQLASNPDDAEALARLEAALLKARDWDGLVALTAERVQGASEDDVGLAWLRLVDGLEGFAAEIEDEPAEVSRLALVTGRICEQELGEVEEAMARYQHAFQLDSSNVEALGEARRIYAASERWDMVIEVLTLEAGATEDAAAQAGLYLQMAEVCQGPLDRAEDALICVRQAQKLAPDHPGLAAYADQLDDASRGRRTRVDEIVAEADAARDPRRRAALLTDAASLWLEEAPSDPAIERLLKEVLDRDARNEHARILLEQFYETNGRWEDLVSWLEARAESTNRRADRMAIYQQLATIAEVQLQDEAAAVGWHRRVLELDAVEPNSLNACVDHYSEREEWLELVQVYEAAVRVRRRGGDESAMIVQIAMILWKKLGQLDEAESYFKRIKLNDPKNRLMLTFYVEFYRAKGDWKRLLATLSTQQTGAADAARKAEIGLEMARVAEEDLGNLQKAIDIWKSLLKVDRAHPEARAALRRLYSETGKWNALLEFLKGDLALVSAEDVAGRLAVYRQMIDIYQQRMKLPRMVIDTWGKVLAEDPGNVEALDALESIYEGRSKWNDLIGILERRVEVAAAAGDRDGQVGLLRRVAALWLDRFSNPAKAREALEALLEIEPGDPAAIDQLVEIHRRRRDWRGLFAIYQQQVAALEGEARIDRLVEMAEIAAERLEQPAEAVALWRQVIAADPERENARDALEALLLEQQAWGNLVTLYRERVGRAEGEARVSWLRKLGQMHDQRLDDPGAASEAWRAVLEMVPGDPEAEGFLASRYVAEGDWDALEALYGEREAWTPLVDALEAAAASAAPAERVGLLWRIARLTEDALGDQAGTVEVWERVLRADPGHAEAAARLAPHYAEVGDWEARVGVLEVLLEAEASEPVALMVELADVHEVHRGDPAAAWPWRARALEARVADPSLLAAAEATAKAADDQPALATLLEGLLDVQGAPVPALQGVLARTLEALGQLPEAASHYEALRADVGAEPAVLEALERLYQRMQSWDALLGIYELRLEQAAEPAERSGILSAMGALHETVREDPDAAREAYEAMRRIDASDVEALRGLQRLARAAGDAGGLADLLQAELELAEAPEAMAAIQGRLGALAEDSGELEEALRCYAAVLEAQPDHPETLASLTRLLDGPEGPGAAAILEPQLRRAGDWIGVRRALVLRVEGCADPTERARLLREVAEIEESRLSDPAAAFATWQRLSVQARNDAEVRGHLERLAESLDEYRVLAEHYGRFAIGGVFAADDPDAALAYSRLLASIQEEALDDPASARDSLEALLIEAGDDLETLAALDRLNTRLEAWDGLVGVCERRLLLLDEPGRRREELSRVGNLWEDVLDVPEEAVALYHRVLEEFPGDARAQAALERLLTKLERWDALADALRDRLDALEGEDRVPVALQLGALLEGSLAAPAEALEQYAAVLDIDPTHEPAVEAIEGLIIEHDDPDSPMDRAIRREACAVLAPIYALREDWQSSVHILQVQVADEEAPPVRAALHREIAALYEGPAGDPRAAFASYGAAFAEVFAEPETLAALERLAEGLGAWTELIEYIDQGLTRGGEDLEPEARRTMLARAVHLAEERVDDVELAIGFARRALAEEPDDDAVLARLDRLYTRIDEAAALADVLERRTALADDVGARRALLFRLAELSEVRLGDRQKAIEVLRQVKLDIDPEDLEAHAALERLYEASGAHLPLVETLVDHAELVEGPVRRDLLMRAAEVFSAALERPEDAAELYGRILADDAEDAEALARVDGLLVALDRPVELLEVLEARQALAADDDERTALDLRVGRLLQAELGEPERAVRTYQAVLARSPRNAEARQALESLLDEPEVRLAVSEILAERYEADGRWAALRDVLRRTLEDREDFAAQVGALERIAEIEETELGDPAAAFSALAEAWRRDDAEPRLQRELERLAAAAGAYGPLADLYEEMIPTAVERAEVLHLRVARIAEERLGDTGRAIGQLRQVLLHDAESAEALDGLERLLSRTADNAALVEILERKAEASDDPATRKPLFVRIAEIQEGFLDDLGAAIETWRRVLGDSEADADALHNLERLLEDQGRWPEVAALLEHRLAVEEDGAERADVEYRLARACEQHLDEGVRAVDLYRHLLEDHPDHLDTQQALARLFADEEGAEALGVSRRTLAEALLPIYRAADAWMELVDVLEVLQHDTDDFEARGQMLAEIAALREGRLGDPGGAFAARGRLLAVDPADADNRAALMRLADAGYRWEALATLLEDTAADAADPALKVELLLMLAGIEETHRGRDGRAAEVYREVLAVEPDEERALAGLVELFGRTASWDDLVQLHLDRAASADDTEVQKAMLFKACQLLEEVVADIERAISVYRRVLDVDPEDERARGALKRFFQRDGRWDELIEMLRDEIQLATEPVERARIRGELAVVLETRVQDLDGAIAVWQAVLEDDVPAHVPAVDALEALLLELSDESPEDPRRRRVAEILEPIYAEGSRWSDWTLTQEIRLEFESDPWQQSDLLKGIARTHEEKLDDAAAAFQAWSRAFAADITDVDVRGHLERLAEVLGAWEALTGVYLAAVEDSDDPDAALSLLATVGEVREARLSDADGAMAAWRQALSLDEANAAALDALERLLSAAGGHADLVEVLGRKAELADEPDDRRALLERIGRLWEEELGSPEEAIEAWRRVYLDEPADAGAIAALVRLYARTEQWPQLVEMLREQYEQAEDDASRAAVLARIARVQEERLADVDEAVQTWRTALELDAGDAEATGALERLLTAEGRWGELIDLLEGERDGADDDAEVLDALDLRIAGVLSGHLGQVVQAAEMYGEVLERSAESAAATAALEALEALLEQPAHRLVVSRVLEPYYTEREAHAAVARILALQLEELEEPGERVAVHKRLGALQRDVLGKGPAAFETFSGGLAEDPADESILEALDALAESHGLHPEFARLLEERAAAADDARVAADLNRRLAQLYEDRLEVPERAIVAWRGVLADDPFDAGALCALERLYMGQQDWPALIEVLNRRIEEGSAENIADLRCKLGYLLEAVEADVPGAVEHYRAVLWDAPEHTDALAAMERLAGDVEHRAVVAAVLDPLYRDAERWDKLALLTEMRIELVEDDIERARLWMASAEIRAEQLGDPASAFAALLQAFAAQPEDTDVRERLLQIGEAEGLQAQLAVAFEAVLEHVGDPETLLEDHERIAAWAAGPLEDPQRAIRHYRAALEIDSTRVESLEPLEALLRGAEDWRALAEVLERRADLVFDLDEKRTRLLALGRLCDEQLGDSDAAARAWLEVLTIDDADGEALDALEAMRTRYEEWAELVEVLERRAESTYDEAKLVALHARIGQIALLELEDGDLAAEAFERVLEIEPEHGPTIERLVALYRQQEAWARLQEVQLKALAAAEDDEAARAEAFVALALNAEAHLDQPGSAREHYRQALSLRPADEAIMERLEVLYREAERWYELVEAWREHLEAIREAGDRSEIIRLLVEIADVAQARLNDADLAIECLNEVLELEPGHGGARLVLAGLYERSGDWEQASDALKKVAATAPEAADRGAAWRRLGLLYRDRLDKPEEARAALRRAIDEADDGEAVTALLDLTRADGDDAAFVSLARRGLQGLTGEARATLIRELAAALGRTGDVDGQIAALEEALELAPEDLASTDALVDAYLDAGRHDEAEPILAAVVERLTAARRFRDLFRYNFRLGCVAEARGDDAGALSAYTACFDFDATYLPNLLRLGKLRYRQEDWKEALRVFQTALLHQMKLDKPSRADLFFHLGKVRLALGEDRKARDMFNRALSQVPGHPGSKAALDDLK